MVKNPPEMQETQILSLGWKEPLEEGKATHSNILASLVAHSVKSLPAMQETQVQSLGQEIPLEKEMATHCSILAWRIPWTEEPGGLSPWGRKESDTNEQLTLSLSLLIF